MTGLTSSQQQQQRKSKRIRRAVSGAANNGSGLIRLTIAAHPFATNDWVTVSGVGGTTEANGSWRITVISGTTIDLIGSTFTNIYTSGGSVARP